LDAAAPENAVSCISITLLVANIVPLLALSVLRFIVNNLVVPNGTKLEFDVNVKLPVPFTRANDPVLPCVKNAGFAGTFAE
jgi:hypothetical protein